MWVNGLLLKARGLLYAAIARWHMRRAFHRGHLKVAELRHLHMPARRRTP